MSHRNCKQVTAQHAPSDFRPTMLAFLGWFFRTLDSRFTESLFAGRSMEEAAEQVLADIASIVKGKRPGLSILTPADYGAMMDCVAAMLLQTRHGKDSVSKSALCEIRAMTTPEHPSFSARLRRKKVSNGH